MTGTPRKKWTGYGSIYTLPLVAWFTLFFLVPLLVVAFGLARNHSRKRLAREEALLKNEGSD